MPSTNRQSVETKRYTMAELYELRRVIIKHSRSIPRGAVRNEHRQIASSMRSLTRDGNWLAVHTVKDGSNPSNRGLTVQKFFFDMKDGVPNRDRVGIEFSTNAEAIKHCKEMAQDFRDNSLRDDQDLEILVVNEIGREIHREFVHRDPE
jgi:hypothetical protein